MLNLCSTTYKLNHSYSMHKWNNISIHMSLMHLFTWNKRDDCYARFSKFKHEIKYILILHSSTNTDRQILIYCSYIRVVLTFCKQLAQYDKITYHTIFWQICLANSLYTVCVETMLTAHFKKWHSRTILSMLIVCLTIIIFKTYIVDH